MLFWGNSVFFRTLRLVLISAKPYYQNACIDRGIIFGFRRNIANDYKLLVRSGFWRVSLMSVFSLYRINLSGTLCGRPPPGPHGGGGGGPHSSGGPTPPGPTAAAVGGGPHGSGGPRPLGGRPRPLGRPWPSAGGPGPPGLCIAFLILIANPARSTKVEAGPRLRVGLLREAGSCRGQSVKV